MKARLRAVNTPGEDRRHGPDGPRPTSERGRRRPRNGSDNPVIVPEELTAGVIAWVFGRPGASAPEPPPPRQTPTRGLAVAPLAAAEAAKAGRQVGGGGPGLGLVAFRRHEETGVPPGQCLQTGRQVVARARLAQPGGQATRGPAPGRLRGALARAVAIGHEVAGLAAAGPREIGRASC